MRWSSRSLGCLPDRHFSACAPDRGAYTALEVSHVQHRDHLTTRQPDCVAGLRDLLQHHRTVRAARTSRPSDSGRAKRHIALAAMGPLRIESGLTRRRLATRRTRDTTGAAPADMHGPIRGARTGRHAWSIAAPHVPATRDTQVGAASVLAPALSPAQVDRAARAQSRAAPDRAAAVA